jgi:MFS superfamily sulfate permease-like transporter
VSNSVVQASPRLEFALGEVSGALGDSVTVLPLVVAVGALSDLSVGTMLVGFGLFQVVWGLYYRVPVSVEPMKALAALVIAGTLSVRGFVVAGLLAGVVLLLVGSTRTLGRIQALVGQPVVRGVQFAVALLLLETGVQLGLQDLPLGLLAAGLVAALAVVGWARAAPLVVLGLGGLLAVWYGGAPTAAVPSFSGPLFASGPLDYGALLGATAGQLAMTVGNAAVATSLLLADYYEADVSPDELATSMGVMNLVAVPLGMIPMCHGSGGVAGKYAFGARTAASNLVLGALYAAAALVATGLVMAFPLSVLGVVLAVVAFQLGRTSLDSDHLGVTLLVGAVSLLSNVGVGFACGVGVSLLRRRLRDGRGDTGPSVRS